MAFWPSDPAEIARWIAALTPAVPPGGVTAGRPAAAPGSATARGRSAPSAAAAAATAPPSPVLTATVDLECPYLRDLVLAAFARRPAWTTIRADPIVTVLDEADRPVKPLKPSDDGNTTSEDEGDGGDGGGPPTLLTPHPAVASSLFHWGEYERIAWDRVHAAEQCASSYCVRKGLTRKAHLAFNLKKWAAKRWPATGSGGAATTPAASASSASAAALLAAATPETHVLQVDDPEYVDEALADLPEVRDDDDDGRPPGGGAAGVWIVKPSLTNRGAGIALVDCRSSLKAALASCRGASEWVVQRYIADPHLLGGRKWHLRLYALAVGATEVWAFSGGGLVLRARAPYHSHPPAAGGGGGVVAPLSDLDAHLTNTCRGGGGGGGGSGDSGAVKKKAHTGRRWGGGLAGAAARAVAWLVGRGRGGKNPGPPPPPLPPPLDPVAAGLALSLADLPAALVAENGDDPGAAAAAVAKLADTAAALVGETFAAVSGELSFFPLPAAWELFGFDFMVDAHWNVYLLEANADPDVGASGEGLKGLIAALVEGTLARTADRVAAAAAARAPTPAVLAPGVWEEQGGSRAAGEAPGAWTRVFVRDAGRAGASGMTVT